MAKLTGLTLRGGVYQLRVVVPKGLEAAYEGRSTIRQSLGTGTHREAVLLGTQARARLLEEFDLKRVALQPQTLDSVSSEMAAELALRVRASVLRRDDHSRDTPAIQGALRDLHALVTRSPLDAITIRGSQPAAFIAPVDPLAGLSAGEASALAGLNDFMSKDAGAKLAQRSLQAVLPLVKEEAHKLGLTFDHTAPGAREALQGALRAYRQAWQEVTQRDAGELTDTPTVLPAKQATARAMKMRDAYTRWKDSKPRSRDAVDSCLRAVVMAEEFTGDPSLSQVTREQGDGFRAWLQHPDRKTTSKTARDRFTWVKSVLKFAARDLGAIPRNPWEGLDIAFKTTNKRRPWTDAELKTFFSQKLHTAYELPKDKKAGAEAAYWIPLLGLYSGARVGELAQLRTEDVGTSEGMHVLTITDDGEGQTVKSAAGVRKVPIHSELVRLGFLEYVEKMRAEKQALLWPLLAVRLGKLGGYFSAWFGEYRRSLGFGVYPDFHCFRHTVRSQMAEAEVSEQLMDAAIGHEVKGSTGAKVYTHRSLKALQRAIEVLRYPSVTLVPLATRSLTC